ncbi:hypothetical protein H2203_001935 [Taxawa tesnikishii (nom. ined.)]|nr:hypothetical protein H2203_001935 [Dothideales sp. JES 119]
MTQPSGMVIGAPTAIAPLLRSSPVVCLLDTIFVFGRLLHHWIQTSNFPSGVTRLVLERFHDIPGGREAGSWNDLRHNAVFRWILFLFAIPQAIKLFALGGLVWTKVWAGMYLVSFFVTELFVLVPRRWVMPHQDVAELRRGVRAQGATSIAYLCMTAGGAFLLYFLIHAAKDLCMVQYSWALSVGEATGLVLFAAGGLAFVPPAVYSWTYCDRLEEILPALLYLLAALAVPLIYLLAFSSTTLAAKLDSAGWSALAGTLLALWAGLALQSASTNYRFIAPDGRPTPQSRPVEAGLAWYFFLMNLATALLYYRFSYDPRGTYKPSWTEQLG